jgi:hypothetical protein
MFFRKKNARGEKRMALEELASVTVQNGASDDALIGTLTDLSPSGAGLKLSQFVMRGLTVDVQWKDGELSGDVQYCRPIPSGGYKVGLRIAPAKRVN